jgi:uncharacterized membrane protein YkgB
MPTKKSSRGHRQYVEKFDVWLIEFLRRWYIQLARGSLFIVYFWFGFLKLAGLSPASPLAEALTAQTIGMQWYDILFVALAVLECIIGVLFLIPRATRAAIFIMLLHMVLVCSPLVLLPSMVWQRPFVPTLEGQYIIKNVVLVAAAISVAASVVPLTGKMKRG